MNTTKKFTPDDGELDPKLQIELDKLDEVLSTINNYFKKRGVSFYVAWSVFEKRKDGKYNALSNFFCSGGLVNQAFQTATTWSRMVYEHLKKNGAI